MGQTTSDQLSLNGDSLIVAQVLSLGFAVGGYAVVTRNPNHMVRFGLANVSLLSG